MTYNNATKKATNKYRSKFDIIQIRVQQGDREKIADHAAEYGESINAFVNRAIAETMKHDGERKQS